MTEKNLWTNIRTGMGSRWIACRHEDSVTPGVPDVSYTIARGSSAVTGWIELKDVPAWPKDPSVPLRVDHFTSEQRIWIRQRGRVGGLCWILIRVGTDYLLFDWVAAEHLGKDWTERDCIENAQLYWGSEDNIWNRLAVKLSGR